MIGKTISHYDIKEQLGHGGMGIVYRALDNKLGRDVALKFLPPELSADEESKARFVQEAQAASALDHPNICTIYEIGESEDGKLFIAMSFYDGQTLKYLMDGGAMEVGKAAWIASQIAAGLTKAHEAGIVHRDIKPANIMVTADGLVKILDFGLAKLGQGVDLTKAGSTVGTTAYMSPEQSSGQEVDGRTDIWSLGVILYEMLSGERAFGGGYDQAVLYSVLNEDPPPLDDVPDDIAAVVSKMIEKNPEDRFGSAEDVSKALNPYSSGTTQISLPAGQVSVTSAATSASTIPWRWIAPVAALLIAVVIWLFPRPGAEEVPTADGSLVILPFNVVGGDDVAYLRNGLVYLLTDRLDGIMPQRLADPNTVVAASDKDGISIYDVTSGAVRAAALGGSRFIIGSATSAGESLILSVSLIEDGVEVTSARAEIASLKEITSGVEELARGILENEFSSDDTRMAFLETRGAPSYDAMRAYIEGAEAFRTQDYTEAEAAANRAIEEDSTYALAWYLKGRAQSWLFIDDTNARSYEKALELGDGLTPRMRQVIEVELDPTPEAYRRLLRAYPDLAGAQGRIGDLIYHTNPFYFKPASEGIPFFLKELEYDPENGEYISHLASYLAKGYGPIPLDSIASIIPEQSRSRIWIISESEQDSMIDVRVGREIPLLTAWESAMAAERFDVARKFRDAAGKMASNTSDGRLRFAQQSIDLYSALSEGRIDDFHSTYYAVNDDFRPAFLSVLSEAYQSPFMEEYADQLMDVAAQMSSMDTSKVSLVANNRMMPVLPGHHVDIPLYVRGIAAVRSGNYDLVEDIRTQLIRRKQILEDSTFSGSFAERLEGYKLYAAGNLEASLEAFRRGFTKPPRSVISRGFSGTDAPARWTMAHILDQLGRTEEAITVLNSIHDGYDWINMYWLGPIYFQRGQWEEKLGRDDAALDTYLRFQDLMQNADSIFDDRKELVQQRVDVLLDARAREPSG